MALLKIRRRPEPVVALSDRDTRLVWRTGALLLDYPSADTFKVLDQLAEAVAQLPDAVRSPLEAVVLHLRTTPRWNWPPSMSKPSICAAAPACT